MILLHAREEWGSSLMQFSEETSCKTDLFRLAREPAAASAYVLHFSGRRFLHILLSFFALQPGLKIARKPSIAALPGSRPEHSRFDQEQACAQQL